MNSGPEGNYSKYRVMILAAGLGTRLNSVTNGLLPKVMMPIKNGKPLLEHTLLLLKNQGFTDFIVNLHYMPEKITSYFGDGSRLGVKISYSDETDRLLNTAGAIKKASSSLTDTFLLLYGDMVHFVDFRPILKFHENNNTLLTAILKRSDHPQNQDLAEIDPVTSRILKWHFRPHKIYELTNQLFTNAGLYILSKKILDFIPPNKPKSLDMEIIPSLFKTQANLYGFPSPTEILDIGSPDRYEFARNWYADQTKNNF
ncbi:MAG: NDP-sugar synthase [Patescibacteria group bacterium]